METLYPFELDFSAEPPCARFPFMFEGKALRFLADGRAAPSCVISHRAAGDMRFDPQGRGASGHGPVRESFFRSLGLSPERVRSLVQVHSRDVFVIGPERPPRQGDGMVCLASPGGESEGICLALTVADCLPVFLLDTRRGNFAALHSGWRGTGIVLKALEIMKSGGTWPEDTAAVLGPCIQSCCYNVDKERAAAFEGEFGTSSPYTPPETPYPLGPVSMYRQDADFPGGAYYLNLQAANARLLAGAGVRHIAHCRDCTFTDERLGSYRREGTAYTRMAALAGVFNGVQK